MGASLAGDLAEPDWEGSVAAAGVELRPASRADLALAFEALRAAMRDYVEATWGAWDDEQQRAQFAPSFDLRTHRIVRCEGEDAGVLAVAARVHCLALERIFLLPRWQRRGLGTAIVRALLASAHARRLPVELTVLRANRRARAFYERLGFRVAGETRTHFHLEAEPASL